MVADAVAVTDTLVTPFADEVATFSHGAFATETLDDGFLI
jgi:hypothetical protein